jgi:hypothetical protein
LGLTFNPGGLILFLVGGEVLPESEADVVEVIKHSAYIVEIQGSAEEVRDAHTALEAERGEAKAGREEVLDDGRTALTLWF